MSARQRGLVSALTLEPRACGEAYNNEYSRLAIGLGAVVVPPDAPLVARPHKLGQVILVRPARDADQVRPAVVHRLPADALALARVPRVLEQVPHALGRLGRPDAGPQRVVDAEVGPDDEDAVLSREVDHLVVELDVVDLAVLGHVDKLGDGERLDLALDEVPQVDLLAVSRRGEQLREPQLGREAREARLGNECAVVANRCGAADEAPNEAGQGGPQVAMAVWRLAWDIRTTQSNVSRACRLLDQVALAAKTRGSS